MLFTVWPETDALHMWMSADAFEEFFPEVSATRRDANSVQPTKSVFWT
jgi:hypothetical protein